VRSGLVVALEFTALERIRFGEGLHVHAVVEVAGLVPRLQRGSQQRKIRDALARAEKDANAFGIRRTALRQTAVGPRVAARDVREARVQAELVGVVVLRDVRQRVDLARDAHVHAGRIEPLDLSDPGFTIQHARPVALHSAAE